MEKVYSNMESNHEELIGIGVEKVRIKDKDFNFVQKIIDKDDKIIIDYAFDISDFVRGIVTDLSYTINYRIYDKETLSIDNLKETSKTFTYKDCMLLSVNRIVCRDELNGTRMVFLK